MIRYCQTGPRQRAPQPKPPEEPRVAATNEKTKERYAIVKEHWHSNLTTEEIAKMAGYSSRAGVVAAGYKMELPSRIWIRMNGRRK